MTPAMHQIGDDWRCGRLEVFQERRACELLNQLILELHAVAPRPKISAPTAIGGSPEGDHYRLATMMVALTLMELGWQATSLGTSLPIETLAVACKRQRPNLLWLSVTYSDCESVLHDQIATLAAGMPATTQLVVGGQAVTTERLEGVVGVSCCSSFVELQKMVRTPPFLTDGG